MIHLRWHYQVFILSGGYWFGGYMSGVIYWPDFLIQFVNVHLLLFGGASAYNSFWDKDTGPIGGLKQPPLMQPWMRSASLAIQFIGLLIATRVGWMFVFFYGLSMLFFWLYSAPGFRWKAHPLRSLVAIGISTGMNSVLLGFLAAGGEPVTIYPWLAATGCSLIILSLYPVSQLYQTKADRARGDETFAIKYGVSGVISFFGSAFGSGLVLSGSAIGWRGWQAGVGFIIIGILSGVWIFRKLSELRGQKINYKMVMRLKYGCSMAFIGFILMLIIWDGLF